MLKNVPKIKFKTKTNAFLSNARPLVKMANQSKFTKEEKQFIIELYLENNTISDIQVKRAFQKKFGNPKRVQKIKAFCFKNVYVTFKNSGLKGSGVIEKSSKPIRKINTEALAKVHLLYEEKNVSVREGARILEMSPSTVHWHLKTHLGLHFYKGCHCFQSAFILTII